MNIGRGVKEARKSKNVAQWELAHWVGITSTYLSLIENGKRKPSLEVLEKIAEQLETPLAFITFLGLESSDINVSKQEAFKILEPTLNELIKTIC